MRGLRGGATAALVGVTLLVGVLTLRAAGWGDRAGAAGLSVATQNQQPGQQPGHTVLAGDAPVPTDTPTDVPTDTPTDTPTPAPTDTPVAPPPPTPTPVPGPITFTCASGTATSGEPTYFLADVCLSTTPGAVVSVTTLTCADDPDSNIWSDIHVGASGTAENRVWAMRSTCGLPLTITLTASGTAPDGSPLAGSTSFTISG